MSNIEWSTIGNAISYFFAHPFVIAITIFFFSQYIVKQIIPDAKVSSIRKIHEIKNYLKELRFVYDRIVMTSQALKRRMDGGENVEEDGKLVEEALPREVSRISQLVNEKIPLASNELNSDIEIYFDDKEISKAHQKYNESFFSIHTSILNELPKQNEFLLKKLSELEGFSFEPMETAEKELLTAIAKAKTLKLRNR